MNASSASVSACADLRLSAKVMPTTEKRRSTVAELAGVTPRNWRAIACERGLGRAYCSWPTTQDHTCISQHMGRYANGGTTHLQYILVHHTFTSLPPKHSPFVCVGELVQLQVLINLIFVWLKTTTQLQVPSKKAHGKARSSQNMFVHTLLIEHSGY